MPEIEVKIESDNPDFLSRILTIKTKATRDVVFLCSENTNAMAVLLEDFRVQLLRQSAKLKSEFGESEKAELVELLTKYKN